jgi:hypothetical protein
MEEDKPRPEGPAAHELVANKYSVTGWAHPEERIIELEALFDREDRSLPIRFIVGDGFNLKWNESGTAYELSSDSEPVRYTRMYRLGKLKLVYDYHGDMHVLDENEGCIVEADRYQGFMFAFEPPTEEWEYEALATTREELYGPQN